MELKFISSAFHDREAFNKLTELNIEKSLSDKGKIIWQEIKSFYDKDSDVLNVDKDLILSAIEREYPKHYSTFKHVIESLEEVSIPNVINEVKEFRKQNLKQELGSALLSNAKDSVVDKLQKQLEALDEEEVVEESKVYHRVSVADLITRTSSENRIKLLPGALNAQCDGGALRQHHIIIFAPTDMGKTLFTINLVSGFLNQGYKVLYIGNEDPAEDILRRIISRLTGKDKYWINQNEEAAQQIAEEKGYDKLILIEASPGTPKEIEEYINEYEPDVLIVDQIRNLDMGADGKVLQLEAAATFMRNMGKKYNLLPVSLTQAADSATGKLLLGRGDIDFSNVGIPGQADLLIGIGANQEWEEQGYRMLSLVKNKISGDKTPIKVRFIPTISKVESI